MCTHPRAQRISAMSWPLQDSVILLVVFARINRPFIISAACIAHTVAILLHSYRAIYDPLPNPPVVCRAPYNIGNNNIV